MKKEDVLVTKELTVRQTSLDKTGSDAMNAAGDYSAAYCILNTDSEHKGHGMVGHQLWPILGRLPASLNVSSRPSP